MNRDLTFRRRRIRACVLAAVSLLGAAAALAGECPAAQRVADGRGQPPGPAMPQGVSDVVRTMTDLAGEPVALQGRQLRLRQLDIQPGGIVPWHSHDDRPALIFVQQGEIVEHASNCVDPIVHRAGDIRPEVYGTSHWWKNLGKETVILYVGDVRKDPHDHNM